MEDWQKEYIERARRIALEQRRSAALAGSENVAGWSDTDQSIFDAYWDNIGLNEALTTVLNQAGSSFAGDFASAFEVSEKDPATQQFRERFGDGGTLRMSVGRPIMYGQDWNVWSKDPNQIIDLGDGRFIYNDENINSDVVNQLRDADSRSGLNLNPITGIAFVLSAGMLGNALLGAEGLAGAAGGGFPAGAGIAGPSLETAGIATGALEGAATTGATTGAATGAATGATTAGTGALGFPIGAGPGVGGPLLETAAMGSGTGSSLLGSAGQWFSSLSPMAQRAITSGLSTGASAIMASRRQQEAQDFARQQQERQYDVRRQEEERLAAERAARGTPSQFTFNVSPRAPGKGLVGSNMGG